MYLQRYRNRKYGNIKTNGYDSKLEADKAFELEMRKKAGEIKGWEAQKRFPIYHKGELITTYKIDFVVHNHGGTIEYIETKGYFEYASRLRWKLFTAEMNDKPGVTCILEKQGKQKIYRSKNYFKK